MKLYRILIPSLLLATFIIPFKVSGQGVLPQNTGEEASQVQTDSVTLQPYPASEITNALGTTGSLIITSLNKQLTPEFISANAKEIDTLLSGIGLLLGDSVVRSLPGKSRRQLEQVTLRAQFNINQIEPVLGHLSGMAKELQAELTVLEHNKQRWVLTLEQGAGNETVISREERIRSTIGNIDSVSSLLQDDLVLILGEQDRLTEKKVELQELLTHVDDQRKLLGETILTRDMPGFFADLPNLRDKTLIRKHVEEFRGSVSSDIVLLKSGYRRTVIVSFLIFLALLAFLVWYKRNHTRLISDTYSDLSKEHKLLINSPVVTSVFISSLFMRFLVPDLPQTFNDLNLTIMLIPMVILMIRMFGILFRRWIILLVSTYALNFVYELAYHPGILLRILLIGMCFAGIWLFYWVYTRKPFIGLIQHRSLYKFFRILVVVFLALQFLAVLANLLGAFRLAEFFTLLPLQITILAIAIQILTKIVDTLLFMILSGKDLQKLNVIREEFHLVYRKSVWLVDFLLLLIFISNVLRLLRIKDAVFAWGRGLLSDGRKFGAIDITLGSILIFFFVIWLSIMISRIITHILEKDLFTRVKTAKGIPGTVSLLLRIGLISGGFFLAAAASGMQLTNLSIVLGAFSVGIGFGLQNIFNNMVSGLILAFERPINVGDVVQVGDLLGTVKSIGLRSSTVHSFDGAEVIVPNGNLISNEMINWTLSDSYRRMDIRVGVAYGTDPERVMAIMMDVAKEHKQVRKNPEPRAYFIGFGDSSLDFRLLAWVAMDHWLVTESELNVLINKKLKEESIEIPFPQRDLHIRSDATKSGPQKNQAE